MSQLLQVATRGGTISILDGAGAPDFYDQGIPYDFDEGINKVAVTIAGIIDHYYQGIPFTAVGRLAASSDKPVGFFGSGAAPFEDVTEFLIFGSGATANFSAGIPYTADGQIGVAVP